MMRIFRRVLKNRYVRLPLSVVTAFLIFNAVGVGANGPVVIPEWAQLLTQTDMGCGGPCPTATPAPTSTPVPPHQWLLLPGSPGLFSAWYYPCGNPPFCDGNGSPDHHDVHVTQHAVDIGAGQCDGPSCPSVYYYDNTNSVTTYLHYFSWSCPGNVGGERVEITLTSINPPGVVQGRVSYLHLMNAIQSGTPTNGTWLGQVHGATPPADPTYGCWTGPHLHEGIDNQGSGASITHYTGVPGSGANCEGNQQARAGVPCYALSW